MQGFLSSLPVGFERPLVLVALPVVVAGVWYFVWRPSAASTTGRRTRSSLLVSRLVIVCLLVVAAAGPTTLATRETPGEPRVTILSDESASTGVAQAVASGLEEEIQAQGVPATTVTIATENRSRLGDGVVANLEPNGHVVLVSDGQTTGGETLQSAAETARSVNATISAVPLEPERAERYISLHGPRKTTVGVENGFLVRVNGVELDDAAQVEVEVDGSLVASREVPGADAFEFTYRFNETGTHRIVASVEGGDRYGVNNVFYKTVRVVEQPKLLYVSQGPYAFSEYLSRLYDVETASSVPADLDPYYAVVLQNVPGGSVGNLDALQRFTINGNGVFVVGGPDAYENGEYDTSTLATMLPVQVGAEQGRQTRIVVAVDVSGSASAGMTVQKALALDAIDQLGDDNLVGLVAFNRNAYRVANLTRIGDSREELKTTIRRLKARGGTSLAAGMQGGREMLGEGSGAVLLITDGWDRSEVPIAVAQRLGDDGKKVITIGVGARVNTGLLREIAAQSGGTFFTADETNRLRLLFGDEDRRYAGDGLTIVDGNHFITTGVQTTANPGEANDVAVKPGAEYLVATGDGTPAVSAWRYGLGRVVSVTAYTGTGGLGGLLSRPDSLLMTKAMNWAIGDPERKAAGVTDVADTRVNEPTRVTYSGRERPQAAGLQFRQTGEETFEATVVSSATGFETAAGATYAVNYPAEYAGFGTDPALADAAETTGGRTFRPTEGAAIARFAQQRATQLRDVRTEWDWVLLVAALIVFLTEVAIRRLLAYRGHYVP